MELLSPAGSMESLLSAVRSGADAVYFGTGNFSARRFAGNFEGDELKAALDYCRLRDIKSYITVNTLVFDKELQNAVEYAAKLYRLGAHAVIVQDFGLACEIRKQLPDLDVHASTQMGIHDENGLEVLEGIGIKRAVLSREVPMKRLSSLCSATSLEIEVFAHGAMCMSFSGNCLFSSMAGERSGNRGTCAQPCRKRMSVFGAPGESDYALSLSDMCMIEHLAELKNAGVSCIKLEGRMKRPEYVSIITRAYREALDGASESELTRSIAKMTEMFNRGGKRTGYYYGNGSDGPVTGCVAVSAPSKALLDEAARTCDEDRTRQVSVSALLKVNAPAQVTVGADKVSCTSHGAIVQSANKPRQDSEERYRQQLLKLGGTPFRSVQCTLDCDANAFVPIGELNELRRQAVNMLIAELTEEKQASVSQIELDDYRKSSYDGKLIVLVRDCECAEAACLGGADMVAVEPVSYNNSFVMPLQSLRKSIKLLLSLPACIIDADETAKIASLLSPQLFDGAIAGNVGQINLIKSLGIRVASSTMNVFNGLTWDNYKRLGFTDFIASEELTKPQLSDILKRGGGLKVYGRTMLMQLKHCPVKEYKGCRGCESSPGKLTDEAGREFPLSSIAQNDGCLVRVLNCVPTDIIAQMSELDIPEFVFAEFRNESPVEVKRITGDIKRVLGGGAYAPFPETTRGHWSRAVK